MNGRTSFRLVLFVIVNFLFSSPANAGVVKRSIRMVREIYPPDVEPENDGNQPQVCIVGDVVYGAEETVPAEQPCLKCRCQPPGVQCETVQCAKKPGCKAIHRPNKCCPDYQCECEHNGKIYANGEKLETNPGGECKVCYCRGGEVQCAEVSCYIRNDCEGKRVPGTCCPKYDHCPPIDAVPDRSSIITETPLNTLKPIILEPWQEPNTTETPSAPTLNNVPEDSNKVPDTSDISTESPLVDELSRKEEELHPRITIQEIIPERKEIPITAPPKIFISEPQGTLLIEEALPTSENTSNDLNIDSEPESSEVSEIFQHPPPVLRIGDKLLFLKKGDLIPEKDTTTPDSVITIIGAEGLQRGGVEESLEVHEVKIEPGNDILEIKKDVNPIDLQKVDPETENPPINISSMLETIYEPSNLTKEVLNQEATAESNDLELRPAESTHILSLVKRKDKNMVTTSTQIPTTQKEEGLTTLTSSIEEPRRSELQSQESTIELETTTLASSSTTITPSTEAALTKNTDPIIEQNPAYPPIPDIMPAVGDISQKFEVELENDNSTTMEIKILPEVFDFLGNKTKNETLQAHSEWLKTPAEAKKNESLIDFKAAILPDELLNQKSPIDEEEEEEEISTDLNETTTESKLSETETTTGQNTQEELIKEGAQLIAEVKISDNAFDDVESSSTITPSITTTLNSISDAKEYFSSSKATDDKVIGDALKEAADLGQTTEELPKLKESLEIDSGEQTTPKTNHSSIMSNENASVESIHSQSETESPSEITDMTQAGVKEGNIELGSVEVDNNNSESILKDVEVFTSSNFNPVKPTTDNVMKQDVELINVSTPKPTKLTQVETSTYELLPTPEEAKSKTIIKREIPSGNSQEDVFKELEKELNAETSNAAKSPEEDRAEADQIFKELLEESEGRKPESKIKSKEQERVDNISDALAGVALKGKLPDANLFKLIGDIFGGQHV